MAPLSHDISLYIKFILTRLPVSMTTLSVDSAVSKTALSHASVTSMALLSHDSTANYEALFAKIFQGI